MTEFKREERYIVIKRKYLSRNDEDAIRTLLEELDVGTVECVVVESDWPECETVWKMIEERVSGQPVEDPRDKVIDSWQGDSPLYDQDALDAAVKAEREACAKVCDSEADNMERGAQHAIENGEHDEVSAIRSTAWKLSVAANRIRAR